MLWHQWDDVPTPSLCCWVTTHPIDIFYPYLTTLSSLSTWKKETSFAITLRFTACLAISDTLDDKKWSQLRLETASKAASISRKCFTWQLKVSGVKLSNHIPRLTLMKGLYRTRWSMFAHSKKTFFAFLAENDQGLVLIAHKSQNGKYCCHIWSTGFCYFFLKLKKAC